MISISGVCLGLMPDSIGKICLVRLGTPGKDLILFYVTFISLYHFRIPLLKFHLRLERLRIYSKDIQSVVVVRDEDRKAFLCRVYSCRSIVEQI